MGNMQAESNCVPFRVQGDYQYPYNRSQSYTHQVDTHQIDRDDFIYHGPGGGGYGLCQWTFWSRKAGLYDLAQKRFVSVGNEYVQIDWLIEELHQGEYSYVYSVLMNSDDIYEMVATFLRKYEKPADQSDSACASRCAMANDIYYKYAGSEPGPEPQPEPDPPEPQPIPETCTPTAPVLKSGDRGIPVVMVQRALRCFSYDLGTTGPQGDGVDGAFGTATENALKRFQAECNIASTGVVDEDTWQILLQ